MIFVAAAGLASRLAKHLKGRKQLQQERRHLMDVAEAAAMDRHPIPAEEFEGYTDPKKYLEHQAASAARSTEKAYAHAKLLNIAAHHEHVATVSDELRTAGRSLASPEGLRTVGAIARAVSSRSRRRGGYYTDSYGRRRRRRGYASESMVDEGEEETPAETGEPEEVNDEGMVPAAEHVAGRVARGDTFGIQGATPAKLAGVAAAGVASYLVTRALLRHFGDQPMEAQRAGVEASKAFREARAEYQREHGVPPTGAQLRTMRDAWIHKLAELGYTVEGGAVEYQPNAAQRFLSTYSSEEE